MVSHFYFISLVVEYIVATDLKRHFDFLVEFNSKVSKGQALVEVSLQVSRRFVVYNKTLPLLFARRSDMALFVPVSVPFSLQEKVGFIRVMSPPFSLSHIFSLSVFIFFSLSLSLFLLGGVQLKGQQRSSHCMTFIASF